MPNNHRTIIVTSALPYANGPIHLGHLVEYIQSDIWCRYQKMHHHTCFHVCADDAHGTAIMLRAQREGIQPEQLIQRIWQEHTADFAGFHIDFNHYHSTHSPDNQNLSEMIYLRNRDAGHITRRTISQAFDPEAGQFLPDRFIRGECPKCRTANQYGDNCEACGATYASTDLKNPVSILSGTTPIEKQSEHLFFTLADFTDSLKEWHQAGHVQPEVANKLQEWFAAGLADWDISRDAPYFGFEIPNEKGKYFYVWLDAPIGYIASFKKFCDTEGLDYTPHWQPGSNTELYHFIGKDIIYFHALFWPAILEGAGLRKPTGVFAHGFLTINGRKMSKSRGTYIKASTYLEHLNPEYLRYYFATKLTPRLDDLDLNFEDFAQRINADLVGKVVNIASRCAGFITKRSNGLLSSHCTEPELYQQFAEARHAICHCYEQRDYAKAMRHVMNLADQANHYINEAAPWVIAKQDNSDATLQAICSVGLNLFRLLIFYLKPVLPILAQNAEDFLNSPFTCWEDCDKPLTNHAIQVFKPLMTRVDRDKLALLLAASEPNQ
jgi:methionyl-tRNA synthetase